MVWIAFVIVVILLYTPVIGLGRVIQAQALELSAPLPVLGTVGIPVSGIPLLLLCSVALWIIVWLILLLLEWQGIFRLEKANLRNGFLYGTRPYWSNGIAVLLAELILGIAVVRLVLPLLATIVGFVLGQSAMDLILAILDVLLRLKFDEGILILCILTLIAATGFRIEQEMRYAADLQRNRIQRKRQQTEIVVPAAER